MATKYSYDEPVIFDLDQLLVDINASAMTDKGIEYSRWDAEPIVENEGLGTFWTNVLSGGDETILDSIVAAS